jgi:hypothetical protein
LLPQTSNTWNWAQNRPSKQLNYVSRHLRELSNVENLICALKLSGDRCAMATSPRAPISAPFGITKINAVIWKLLV